MAAIALFAGLLLTAQSAMAAPTNDAFASAQPLSGTSTSATGTTMGATTETGEPDHFVNGHGSVWYAWTAPVSGVVTLDVCTNTGSTKLQLYQGTALNSLQEVGQRHPFPDPQCPTPTGDLNIYHVTGGTEYRISAAAYGLSGTNFTLNLNEVAGPANDLFGDATDLGSPTVARVAGNTANASVEPGEMGYESNSEDNESVWYRFQEPKDTPMWIDSCDASEPFGPAIHVYRGSSPASLTEVGPDFALTPEGPATCQSLYGIRGGPEVGAFTARAGTTYHVQILRDNLGTQGSAFQLGLRRARFDGSLTQKSSRSSVRRGQTVTFKVVVRNRGDLPMSPAIDIVAPQPHHLGRVSPGTRYISLKPSQGRCKRVKFFGVIPGAICEPRTIRPGGSMTITAKVRAGSPFEQYAEIDYLHQGEGNNDDDNPKNDSGVRIIKVHGGGHG